MTAGILYLVGTPIGNLGDMTPRAVETLRTVDLIAAEDTRRTRGLLSRYDLHKPMESYHAHNVRQKGERLLEVLQSGRSVALVSDAGMPSISDPGSDIVRLCAQSGIEVVVVPGPCAAIAGLAGSGLDTGRFVFEGFLPIARKERRLLLARLKEEDRTIVLYEAPHRIRRTLADLSEAGMGDRRLSAGRELTKLHEEFIRLTVDGLVSRYTSENPRGEYVLVLEGREAFDARTCPVLPEGADSVPSDAARMRTAVLLAEGMPVREIARLVAQESGITRKEAYALALSLKDSDGDPR